jgi:hypothetical protein
MTSENSMGGDWICEMATINDFRKQHGGQCHFLPCLDDAMMLILMMLDSCLDNFIMFHLNDAMMLV